jgi:hypothetical protein
MGSTAKEIQGKSHYSQYLPDLTQPRFTNMSKQSYREYAEDFKQNGRPPWLHALWMHWRDLFKEPYKGISTDGRIIPDLFPLQDEGMPIESITSAANDLLSLLTPAQTQTLTYHIDSPEWRTWSNPEFLLSDKGLRLEDVSPAIRTATMSVLRATLSPEGYSKAISAMRINHFLGELCACPTICNSLSYNFVLFGTPSTTTPWGISFYGHHLCLNIFLHRTQVIISPWFTGAEPNEIDSGPYAGTRILHVEESLGLQLMRSLPPKLQAQAQIYAEMKDPRMPPGRWNRDDQRHLCGAFRDNRVIPNEGVLATSLTEAQQTLLLEILTQYLLYLPQRSRELKLEQCRSHFPATYFSWIGPFASDSAFYFRIQSPVIIVEFDHHSGVFLNNAQPAKFHVHTLMRTPNAGDYGMALRPLIAGMEQNWVWEEDLKGNGEDARLAKGRGEGVDDEWKFRAEQ